ncbi:glucosaminidase domain-containing protein [Staphylococcus caledonicus]|uniref:glucosaminidase domain-containing protein n=1 Tax=Staphylococcus caledonicus TaxID=2741333 RepID=UPI0018E458F3
MTNKTQKRSLLRCLKLMCGSALIVSTCFTTYESTSSKHVAKASNLPVIDAQQGCTVGGDKDSKTSKDDVSPKDQNINMKKYKSTFEKNAKGGKLEGKADKVLEIAEKEKVPPLLMVAIMVNESGWGTGANAMKQNNPLSVMGNKSIGDSTYDTIEEGLEAGAKNLYEGYIKEGLDTPKKIGPKYAPVGAANDPTDLNSNWIPNTEQVMKDLGAEDIKSSSSDDKDDDKEEKDTEEDTGASSADTSNDSVPKSACGEQDKSSDDSSGGGKTSGKLGASTKANGKSGKKIEGNWTYDEIPEKYKKHIELPKFQPKYLKGSPFVQSGDNGQCTEFTWAMMNQLYVKDQPAFDGITNGDSVYKIYEKRGAKTTHNPTVGYGFSSSPPYALAAIPGIGHTGVVAGVMDDGKFIIAQMNVDPDPAPSRTVLYSVIDGVPKDAGNNLIFFEGVGEPKKEYKKGK